MSDSKRYPLLMLLGLIGAGLLGAPRAAKSICPPFPCEDCWIFSEGQLNLVVMDRENRKIQLVPNIRFTGNSRELALVVPTPALPVLAPAQKAIWDEAREMTKSVRSTRGRDESYFGCGSVTTSVLSPADGGGGVDGESDDVVIHGQQTVGAFEATIVSSESPNALLEWLNENGFVISPEDAALFVPYVERDWFFTAMKLDTTDAANRMPEIGWDAEVNPVSFTYESEEFELPLPILTINKAPVLPIVVYTVDEHRTSLPGFTTDYANQLTAREFDATISLYPSFSAYLGSGRYLTRLRRTFTDPSTMSESVMVTRAPSNDEFRRVAKAQGLNGPFDLMLVALPVALWRWRLRRRGGARLL